MQKIKINNKNYNLRYSIRSLFYFEQITNKAFEINTITDNFIFLYCCLLASNEDMKMTFDEFVDVMDREPNTFKKLNEALQKEQYQNNLLMGEDDNTKDSQEKKS